MVVLGREGGGVGRTLWARCVVGRVPPGGVVMLLSEFFSMFLLPVCYNA